eukprot:Nk52_evm2s1448 gene=Nk52_evmTU2s1448
MGGSTLQLSGLIISIISSGLVLYGTGSIYTSMSGDVEKDNTWPLWLTGIVSFLLSIVSYAKLYPRQDAGLIPLLHFSVAFFAFYDMVLVTDSVSICKNDEARSRYNCQEVYCRFAGLGGVWIAHFLHLWDTAPRCEVEDTYVFK